MYGLPAEDSQIEHVHVTVVTIVTSAASHAAIADLRRESIRVDVGTPAVFDEVPAAPVYVVCLDAALSNVVAEKIVGWANLTELRPGLIGLVHEGTGREREALLAAGFDDVIVAPASGRELAARVRAVHRRVHWKGINHGRLRYGAFTLDLYGHALWIDAKIIPLTSIELAVLRELMKARGRPLSRGELLDSAWGEADLEVSERAVDNVILRLRRKLPRPEMIETVRSVGFRLTIR